MTASEAREDNARQVQQTTPTDRLIDSTANLTVGAGSAERVPQGRSDSSDTGRWAQRRTAVRRQATADSRALTLVQRRCDSTPSATASLSAGPVLGAPTRNLGDVSLTDVFAGPPAVCYSYLFAADDEHPAAANTSRPRARACRYHLSAAFRHQLSHGKRWRGFPGCGQGSSRCFPHSFNRRASA